MGLGGKVYETEEASTAQKYPLSHCPQLFIGRVLVFAIYIFVCAELALRCRRSHSAVLQ